MSKKRRARQLEGLRALVNLVRDPNDTSYAFIVIRSFGEDAEETMLRRLRATEVGRRILGSRRTLAEVLIDRDALRAMPEGSLGRAYLEYCAREGITAEGLVTASEAADPFAGEELEALSRRMRDSHDLWHLVTGYETDLLGELGVLAFSAVQTRNPGVWMLVLGAMLRATPVLPEAVRVVSGAIGRARKAAWLPGADWEELLARPLTEVRAMLSIDATPRYRPYRHDAHPVAA